MNAGTKIVHGLAVAGGAAWILIVSLRMPEPAVAVEPAGEKKPAAVQATRVAPSVSHSPEDVLGTASVEELAAAVRRRMTAGAAADEIRAALELLARRNPLKALELALALTRSEEEKHGWVSALLGGWARRDPVAAWGWANAPTQQYAVPGDPSLS